MGCKFGTSVYDANSGHDSGNSHALHDLHGVKAMHDMPDKYILHCTPEISNIGNQTGTKKQNLFS